MSRSSLRKHVKMFIMCAVCLGNLLIKALQATALKRREVTRPRRFVHVRLGDLKEQSDAQNRIHVRLGQCWIMTGIVLGSRMMWRRVTRGMTTCVERRRQATRVMQSAFKMFISKVQRSDRSLKAIARNGLSITRSKDNNGLNCWICTSLRIGVLESIQGQIL